MAGSEATLRKTLGHGDWQTPGHSVIQQLHAQVYMTSINTTLLRQIIIHPVRHLALYCYNIYYALLLQLLLRSYYLDRHSNYYVSMIYMVTAPITSLWPLCYSNYFVPMIYIETPTITSLWSILLQQLLGPYDPYCYSTYYVTRTSILQQLLLPYDLHRYSNTIILLWYTMSQHLWHH